MIDQLILKEFSDIYDKTYNNVLRFVVCRCPNIDDVNDILQETYLEFYKLLINNKTIDNIENYIIGIAKNKVNKHYNLLYKLKTISMFSKDNNSDILDKISDSIDIENIVLNNIDKEFIWNYLKKKKIIIQRIFYLYYSLDLTIKEISEELNVNQSYIKNCLYRTLKELQQALRKEYD